MESLFGNEGDDVQEFYINQSRKVCLRSSSWITEAKHAKKRSFNINTVGDESMIAAYMWKYFKNIFFHVPV